MRIKSPQDLQAFMRIQKLAPLIAQMIEEYDAASKDAEFEEGHPIFQMAAEIDELHSALKEYAGFLYEALECAPGSPQKDELVKRITHAILNLKI